MGVYSAKVYPSIHKPLTSLTPLTYNLEPYIMYHVSKALALQCDAGISVRISRPPPPYARFVLSLFAEETSPTEALVSTPEWTILGPTSALWPSHLRL